MNLRVFKWLLFLLLLSGQAFSQDKVDILDLSNLDLADENVKLDEIEVKDTPENELKVEEIIEPTSEYRYASFGKEDPFAQPPMGVAADTPDPQGGVGAPASSEIPMVSPLQAYPLDQLAVKGVWVLPNGQARAVIMTPKKEGS